MTKGTTGSHTGALTRSAGVNVSPGFDRNLPATQLCKACINRLFGIDALVLKNNNKKKQTNKRTKTNNNRTKTAGYV